MIEKRFRVRFELKDGRGEIVNEKGVELSAREVVDLLNGFCDENRELEEEDARLNQIIIGKCDEIAKIKTKNKKLQNIVIWQQEIIQNYNELMQIVSSD